MWQFIKYLWSHDEFCLSNLIWSTGNSIYSPYSPVLINIYVTFIDTALNSCQPPITVDMIKFSQGHIFCLVPLRSLEEGEVYCFHTWTAHFPEISGRGLWENVNVRASCDPKNVPASPLVECQANLRVNTKTGNCPEYPQRVSGCIDDVCNMLHTDLKKKKE